GNLDVAIVKTRLRRQAGCLSHGRSDIAHAHVGIFRRVLLESEVSVCVGLSRERVRILCIDMWIFMKIYYNLFIRPPTSAAYRHRRARSIVELVSRDCRRGAIEGRRGIQEGAG